jgi:hypothetical protein
VTPVGPGTRTVRKVGTKSGLTRSGGAGRPGRRVLTAGTALPVFVLGAGFVLGTGGATSAAAQDRGLGVASASGAAGVPGVGEAPSVPTPLATSVRANGGTWATVAMGDLGQPLNTFWQLMFHPDGAGKWTDHVEATATATNGGLVLAGGGGSLIVGVRPSNDLTFSPLISTTNGGRSWSDGLLDQGLASRPEALAAGPGGRALAIVEGRGGAEVVRSNGNLTTWQPLMTARALAAVPSGRTCDPATITSVGYLAGAAVLGTSCQRSGQSAIFVQQGETWHQAGPPRSSSSGPYQRGRAEVLGLMPDGGGLAALVGLAPPGTKEGGAKEGGAKERGAATTLDPGFVVAWATTSGIWRTSPAYSLGTGHHLASFGATPAGGVFVLGQGPSGGMALAVAGGPGLSWRDLPAPPNSTATVAFLPGGTVDALAVKSTTLTVWALSPGTTSWAKAQVLDVPVQFGSSS